MVTSRCGVPWRPSWKRRGLAVLMVLGAASLSGCSLIHHVFGGGNETRTAPIITLRVDNRDYYDATVFAVTEAGERHRIGRVTGLSHDTFRFRWLYNDLRVLVQLLADGSAVTQSVPVTPGDSINLVIQPDFHLVFPD